jgi:hypothetical protein
LIEAFCRLTNSAGEHEQNQEDVKEIHEYAPCLGLAARVSLNHGAVSMITPAKSRYHNLALVACRHRKTVLPFRISAFGLKAVGHEKTEHLLDPSHGPVFDIIYNELNRLGDACRA